jgi:uncharacterized protein YyaL (SSP411 family)
MLTSQQKPLYKTIVYETLDFIEKRQLLEEDFLFFLDADSEGEEGKYYV